MIRPFWSLSSVIGVRPPALSRLTENRLAVSLAGMTEDNSKNVLEIFSKKKKKLKSLAEETKTFKFDRNQCKLGKKLMLDPKLTII